MRIGVVSGLAGEAACLGRAKRGGALVVRCTGARAEAAAAAAEALIEDGCRGLISFGMAGGLKPGLAAGTLVVAEEVVLPDGSRLAVDRAWHGRLRSRLAGAVPLITNAIAAVEEPLLTPEAKAACRRATGAVAVDMESGRVAVAAASALSEQTNSVLHSSLPGLSRQSMDPRDAPRDAPGGDEKKGRFHLSGNRAKAGVPFLVIRAIADPAERAIPAWVVAGVTADGRTPVEPVLARLARRPADLRPLLRLALDARAALKSLRRVAALAGPFLAFDG